MDMPVHNIVSEIDLKPGDALLPLFEAIVNSILSLKMTKDIEGTEKKVQVQVFRDDFPNTLLPEYKTICDFKVIDNGEGFTDANLQSFKTAYSRKNKDLGCKGIGRFTILAGFEEVKISSSFKQDEIWKQREIQFDTKEEVKITKEENIEETALQNRKTIVDLIAAKDVIKSHLALSLDKIAESIMEHCLIYYLGGDLPIIEILDKEDNKIAIVNELYKSLSKEREKEFEISKQPFRYYITKTLKTNNRKNHYIHYCANSRVVGSGRSLVKVNTLFAYPIIQNGIPCFLDIYVVSLYLDRKVFKARNGFDIANDRENTLFNSGEELSFTEIETSIAKQLESEYDSFVKETQNRNIREVKEYIQTKAPRYKRFLQKPEILDSIPPNLSDDKKEEHLYRISFTEKKSIDTKIQKFIEEKEINEDTIRKVKQELIDKTAFDSDCLADYMIRRKAIIDIFNKFLEADKEGKYRLEEDIHNLIFPMGLSMDKIDYESHNLWMLDERFATYSFIDSDKPISSISQKKSKNEPDLVLVDSPMMFDNPISFSADASGQVTSMVIFEFKRPGETAHQKNKSDFRWEFSELVEKYFDDFLYSDNKKNHKGRQVIVEKNTPKFGYIIVDVVPPRLKEYNINKGFKATPFGTLYKINSDLNMHLEVITFEQLVKAVEKRHAPFFDKLFA